MSIEIYDADSISQNADVLETFVMQMRKIAKDMRDVRPPIETIGLNHHRKLLRAIVALADWCNAGQAAILWKSRQNQVAHRDTIGIVSLGSRPKEPTEAGKKPAKPARKKAGKKKVAKKGTSLF